MVKYTQAIRRQFADFEILSQDIVSKHFKTQTLAENSFIKTCVTCTLSIIAF